MKMDKNKILNKKIIHDVIIFLAFIILAGILSISLGTDRSTDVYNYHIYNPWAFLNNRIGFDLLPADIQSYFNPLLDIPYFLMIKYFNNHPMIITFLWGFSYALFLFMIYKISALIFKNYCKLGTTIVSIMIASGTVMVVRHIGWLSPDILIGDFALIALYLILKSFGKDYHPKLIFIAGLIAGVATGLKYTAVIFAIPLLVTFLIFFKKFTNTKKSFLLLFAGMVTGFLITDGFWMFILYKEFHNPLFPYFNWLFHSDYINMPNVFTSDFSQGLNNIQKQTLLLYPFYYTFDRYFQIFYSLIFINLLTIPFVKKENFENIFKINLDYADFILIFSFMSYLILAKTFAIVRYYAPVYGMVGIIIIITLLKIFYILSRIIQFTKEKTKINFIPDIIKYHYLYIMLSLICLSIAFIPNYKSITTRPGARIPIGEELIKISNANIHDNSIVLVERGTGIVIPFQNPYAKYIGLNSYRFTKTDKVLLSDKYIQQIKTLIQKYPKHVYILANRRYPEQNEHVKTELDKLGLYTLPKRVKVITTNFQEIFYLIKLEIK